MTSARTATWCVLFLALVSLVVGGCGRSQLGGPADAGITDAAPPVRCEDDSECDDGNACTGTERCVGGFCEPGTPVACDDGVECTADTCDGPTGECYFLPDHSRCERGELCDEEEGCRGRACTDSSQCDDGELCNGVEYCLDGRCQPGLVPSCDDGIACTTDRCEPATGGCAHQGDDAVCDDGRYCNGLELCDAFVGCMPGAPVRCDDGNACTEDSCDDAIDRCVHDPTDADRDGYASCGCAGPPCDCDDLDVTVNPGMTEQCRDRRDNDCDRLIDCDDRDDCADDPRCGTITCEGDDECDNGAFCDGLERCLDGRCTPGTAVDCDDGIDCTVDTCDEAMRSCLNEPDPSRCDPGEWCDPDEGCVSAVCTTDRDCDDGLYCDGLETCGPDGLCVRGPAVACVDRFDCTEDTCDETIDACTFAPNDRLCRDESICNGRERCDPARGCVPGVPIVCDDLDPCTDDACDEGSGVCRFTPWEADADLDGFTDCACSAPPCDCDDADPTINPGAGEVCDDLIDNDCDDLIDCDDPVCVGDPGCCVPTGDEVCNDRVDNDCNGAVDCDDFACFDSIWCCEPTGREVCDDGIDNDCDGRTDCDDPADCRRHRACCVPSGPEDCDDGVDNDCDGFTDCSDLRDCFRDPACADCIPELCWDGVDNDCDDIIDCDDPDCSWFPPCDAPEIERECHNWIDDDFDGAADCDDPDCAADPMCPEPDTCGEPYVIDEGTVEVTGTTMTLSDDYAPDTSGGDPGCRGGDGPEAVMVLTLAEASVVRLDTFGSAFDTVLYVRADDCETGDQVACNDDTVDGVQSEVTFSAGPGVVYIFLDGYGFMSRGDYVLHIAIAPLGDEVCDNGIDDDADGATDCDDEDCAGFPGCVIEPERGVAACTDGRDNDRDGLVDCDDTEDCAVVDALGECCNGEDDNGNGVVDEFACACADSTECARGYCYVETAGACGPSCTRLGGDRLCNWVFPGSHCSPRTNTCVY